MFPEWTWIVALFIGAAIGSFLNVVIYRMPRGMSLSEPKHSFCPNCKHRLLLPDLFPLLSWLVLRGKCRHCKVSIPSRYFWVELLTGSLWAGIWWQDLIVGWNPARAALMMFFVAGLVAAIFIDLRHYIIPDQVNAWLLFCGLVYNVALIMLGRPEAYVWGIPSAIAGWIVGVAVLWGIAFLGRLLFQKDAMGHGDIKMARGIGAMLFPAGALLSFGMAVILGAVLGLVQILVRRRPAGPDEPDSNEPDDEPYIPESIPSLLKCGLGYLLAIDVLGLFAPKLYESWFGENPFAMEDVDEDEEISFTMIPFGPYLALGALVVVYALPILLKAVEAYWKNATGGLG